MFDTLGRRLRFGPPQARGEHVEITERVVTVFETINRHGPLPVHYFHAFIGGNLRHLSRILGKLNHCTKIQDPYLFRPEQQWASINGRFQPNIYDLTPAALAILAERGISIVNRTDPFLHRFMGACVSASIQIAAERKQLKFGDTASIVNHPKAPPGLKEKRNPLAIPAGDRHVVPDNLFVLQGDKPYFYAVEIDRRTESISSDTAKTAYGKKLHGYLDILENKTYRAHFGIPHLRVLTITTNPIHLQTMLTYFKTLNAPKYAEHFLFKAIPGFSANWGVPNILYGVFTEPWIAADGSRVKLA